VGCLLTFPSVTEAVDENRHDIKTSASIIVFSACLDQQWDIFSWRPFSGNQPQQLTETQIDEMRPSLSSNQSVVVYEESSGHIKGYFLKTKQTFQITSDDECDRFLEPAVSPDGRLLIGAGRYQRSQDITDLVIKRHWRPDSAELHENLPILGTSWSDTNLWEGRCLFMEMVASQFAPAWARDGQYFAFINIQDRGNASGHTIGEIWEARTDCSYARQLTLMDSLCQNPAWAPNGQMIAFSCYKNGQLDIYTVNRQTRQTEQITKHVAKDDQPVFSPDGQSILFVSNRTSNSSLWLFDLISNNVKELKPFGSRSVQLKDPDWQ
jgi:Tol biopolymer transport system component